ncbi:MAG: site-2 protease family protein [Haloarculaceae archaeon]
MVGTLTLVLVGLLVYTAVAMLLREREVLPEWIRLSGPLTTVHTRKGRALLDRLARPRRAWRAWGNFGVGVALVVMVGSFFLVVLAGYQAFVNPQPSPLTQPRNVVAIPGVNEFLPLSLAPEIVAGLVLGLIVHEGGHGLMCRVEDIDISSMGLVFLAIVPIGAFVEPDEESRERADRGAQTRMFSAGVMNNFALAAIALLLLVGPVVASIGVVAGVPVGGVLPGSGAAGAGIKPGDVVTAVDGRQVGSSDDLEAALADADSQRVPVTLRDGSTVSVERSLVVTAAAQNAPVPINTTITAINGTPVYTNRGLERLAANHTVAAISTAGRGEITAPLGAAATVAEEGALAGQGAPAGTRVVVTSIDGHRTVTGQALFDVMQGRDPGDEVTVTAYVDGQRRVYDLTLGKANSEGTGTIGVVGVQRGISGFEANDFGIQAYPAGEFLTLLGGQTDEQTRTRSLSLPQRTVALIALPFASVALGSTYNFPGFTGIATNFFVVQGPLAAFGPGVVFALANLLYWTAWINLIIGQFNCVPSFPLDGGHILRTSSEAIISRLPVQGGRRLTTAVTVSISLIMLAGLFLMVFGPRLFAG